MRSVVAAARQLQDQGIARPIVLGASEEVAAAAQQAGVSLDGICTLETRVDSSQRTEYIREYARRREIDERVARRMVQRPLVFGGMMVAAGDADTMVAGVANATATVIQAGALTVGLAPGIQTASSFFLMILPEFRDETDCAADFRRLRRQHRTVGRATGRYRARFPGQRRQAAARGASRRDAVFLQPRKCGSRASGSSHRRAEDCHGSVRRRPRSTGSSRPTRP